MNIVLFLFQCISYFQGEDELFRKRYEVATDNNKMSLTQQFSQQQPNSYNMSSGQGQTLEGIKVETIKPHVDRFAFPDGHGVIDKAGLKVGAAAIHPRCSRRGSSLTRLWL
mgnify:CR=1 FL=1